MVKKRTRSLATFTMSLDATMRMIDAHANAMRDQDEAWERYIKANDNAQRASVEIFECRMKHTIACHCCGVNIDLRMKELNDAERDMYRTCENATWLHRVLLMKPEYIRWISQT